VVLLPRSLHLVSRTRFLLSQVMALWLWTDLVCSMFFLSVAVAEGLPRLVVAVVVVLEDYLSALSISLLEVTLSQLVLVVLRLLQKRVVLHTSAQRATQSWLLVAVAWTLEQNEDWLVLPLLVVVETTTQGKAISVSQRKAIVAVLVQVVQVFLLVVVVEQVQ
jgi:hypothetical protein